MPGELLRTGHFSPVKIVRLANLHVHEFAGHVRRHVGAADPHARRQALFLIPPAAALGVRQESQVLSVRKNTHLDPPEFLPENEVTTLEPQLHNPLIRPLILTPTIVNSFRTHRRRATR
jgi:hypothetical protein